MGKGCGTRFLGHGPAGGPPKAQKQMRAPPRRQSARLAGFGGASSVAGQIREPSEADPRNPRPCLDRIEGRRNSVSDSLEYTTNCLNLQSSFLQEVAFFPLRELGLRFFGLFCAGVWNEDDTPTNSLIVFFGFVLRFRRESASLSRASRWTDMQLRTT